MKLNQLAECRSSQNYGCEFSRLPSHLAATSCATNAAVMRGKS